MTRLTDQEGAFGLYWGFWLGGPWSGNQVRRGTQAHYWPQEQFRTIQPKWTEILKKINQMILLLTRIILIRVFCIHLVTFWRLRRILARDVSRVRIEHWVSLMWGSGNKIFLILHSLLGAGWGNCKKASSSYFSLPRQESCPAGSYILSS